MNVTRPPSGRRGRAACSTPRLTLTRRPWTAAAIRRALMSVSVDDGEGDRRRSTGKRSRCTAQGCRPVRPRVGSEDSGETHDSQPSLDRWAERAIVAALAAVRPRPADRAGAGAGTFTVGAGETDGDAPDPRSPRSSAASLTDGEIGLGESLHGRRLVHPGPGRTGPPHARQRHVVRARCRRWRRGCRVSSNSSAHRRRDNSRAGSRRNIHAHYDLGNDFFRLFLDREPAVLVRASTIAPTIRSKRRRSTSCAPSATSWTSAPAITCWRSAAAGAASRCLRRRATAAA